MKEIVVASKNTGKIKEIAAALKGLPVTVKSLIDFAEVPEAEETGATFQANAEMKARYYAKLTGRACLADDSGLEVDALNGAPGVFSARFAGVPANDRQNNAKLLTVLQGVNQRTARFRCALVFLDTDETMLVTSGTCEGTILKEPHGTGGFGYDPLFFLPQLSCTMAELAVDEKNKISHRGQAVRNMTAKLTEYLK